MHFFGLEALDHNQVWKRMAQRAMRVSGPSRDERVARTMEDLLQKGPDVAVSTLEFTQYNVRGRGHEGTNACAAIVRSLMASFLFDGNSISKCLATEDLRRTCEQQVQDWAARDNTDAPDPGNYIAEYLGGLGPVSRETHVLAEELKSNIVRILCATQRPFTIATTVPHVPGDGVLRCEDASYTFASLVDHQAMGAFDSHLGRVVVVQGYDATSAAAFAEHVVASLVKALSASADQLELVVFGHRRLSDTSGIEALTQLLGGSSCEEKYVQAFAEVAKLVLSRWSCRLGDMGDVWLMTSEYRTIKDKILVTPHWLPPWLTGCLFFILHQLRFSDLMMEFVRLLHHEDAIWLEQGEDELETALQGSMGAIVDKVMTTWSTMVTPSQPDSHYLIERNLIPGQLLKYIGGYAEGPRNWSFSAFPFRKIGGIMVQLGRLNLDEDDKLFKRVMRDLHSVLPPGISVGSYSLVHKVRTYQEAEGVGHAAKGWNGANKMSAHNLKMWLSLGKPSPAQFSAICGQDFPPLEAGFHLCFIGQLFRKCVAEDQAVDDSKVASLCKDLATLDWVRALSQDVQYRNALQREEAVWNRATWHSPQMKYALAKASTGEEVAEEESSEEEAGLNVEESGKAVLAVDADEISSRFYYLH